MSLAALVDAAVCAAVRAGAPSWTVAAVAGGNVDAGVPYVPDAALRSPRHGRSMQTALEATAEAYSWSCLHPMLDASGSVQFRSGQRDATPRHAVFKPPESGIPGCGKDLTSAFAFVGVPRM
jgi:hypothetical protein